MFVGGKHRPYLPEAYEEARRLRRAGVPIKQIAALVEVSPSTVHRWTTDIALTAEQRAAIDLDSEERWKLVVARRNASWSARCRERRIEFQEAGRRKAREREPLHLTGCMLYWAEGSKGRNVVTFANSDPEMLRLFAHFLRESMNVPDERMAIRLNVYTNNGLSIEQIEAHWLGILGLPASCLRGHSLNHLPTSSSGKKKNKLPYGVCTLSVGSTELVQHIYGAIQEYANFDEPAWLD